jgi:hypothetical protein
VRRSLDAGRIAGGAKNRQPWRFLVLGDRGLVDQVAHTVYASPDLLGAPRVIANCGQRQGPVAFDAGRAAQNMMLAAWNEEVGCPNGIANPESLAELLGLKADEQGYGRVLVGYPAHARDPEARPSEECPPRRCARPPLCSSRSGSRSRKSRSRSRRATPTTSSGSGSPRRATRSTRTSGSAGASSTSTSSSRSAARCTSLGPPPGGSALARCGQSASPATASVPVRASSDRLLVDATSAPEGTAKDRLPRGACGRLRGSFARRDCGHRAWGDACAGCAAELSFRGSPPGATTVSP